MDRVKVTCTFLTLVILVVTNSVGCSRTLDQLILRRSVNIPKKNSLNSGKVMKSCRYITKGRPQHVMHVRDGTICSEVPFISEGFCLHGLCVGSYRQMSVQELAEDTTKARYQAVQSVKCSEYRRNATAARFLVDCSFRCQEKGTVYIVQERKWMPCEVWQGQCFYGECVQEYIGAPNSDKDDENEDLCSKYKLNTTVNHAVTTCSYWCSEGSTPYNVYVLNGILCAKSESTNGICMDGECDTEQQLTMAVLYNPTPRKQSDELASGITSPSLSTENNITHSTTSFFDVTYQTTTNSDPRNSEAVTNVQYTKVINAATKLEGTRPVEVAYTTRLPYVIFTDFFQKFATAGVPLE